MIRLAVVVASLFGTTALSAQQTANALEPQRLGGASLIRIFQKEVAAAEAQGASYPRVANATERIERRCVGVIGGAQQPHARQSGEFQVGSFFAYPGIWHSGQGKLWFAPTHPDTQAVLTVEARRLDSVGVARVYVSSRIGRVVSSMRPLDPKSVTSAPFYPTNIRLPSPGTWLLIVRAGMNWGCFVFEFQ